jgi:hypothetical protein
MFPFRGLLVVRLGLGWVVCGNKNKQTYIGREPRTVWAVALGSAHLARSVDSAQYRSMVTNTYEPTDQDLIVKIKLMH